MKVAQITVFVAARRYNDTQMRRYDCRLASATVRTVHDTISRVSRRLCKLTITNDAVLG